MSNTLKTNRPLLAAASCLYLTACSEPAQVAPVAQPPLQTLPSDFAWIPLGEPQTALSSADTERPEFDPHAIAEVKGGGLGLIDFDRDGLLDIYVPGSQTLSNPGIAPGARLFRNLGDNAFELQTDSGIDWQGWGMGVAIGDLDGDGYDDIFTTALGQNAAHFHAPESSPTHFEERATLAGLADDRWGMAAALGDLDNDGDLDMYVVNYLDLDLANLPPDTSYLDEPIFAGPLGLTPTADLLLRNAGDGTFQDKSFRSGIGAVKASFGLGATVIDLNEDGLLDVFVGNDSMANFLFENQGGFAFEDVAPKLGLAANGDGRDQATMGIAISDISGDGLPDLFSTNFASDTNTLLIGHRRASGSLSFRDRTARFGAATGSRSLVGWASLFADFDLDGDEDLVVFNGHVYPERLASKMGSTSEQAPLFYRQNEGRFQRQESPETGDWVQKSGLFRGAVRGDLDNDGDIDLVVTELGRGASVLLNNNVANGAEWLKIQLVQEAADHSALGSRVTLIEGESRRTQWVQPAMGFQGSGTTAVTFALKASVVQRSVEITWPDGTVQTETLDSQTGAIAIQRSAK